MNPGMRGRMARREDAPELAVIRLVVIGATVVAAVAGVAFAQQSANSNRTARTAR